MKQYKINVFGLILMLLMVCMACSLTSPTPASWSRTPTAEARAATNAAIALTQQAALEQIGRLGTPTPDFTEEKIFTPTYEPTDEIDGPWLVYPGGESGMLYAYDLEADQTIEINLPEPIYTADLLWGLSPDRETLIVRAGSPLNLDELALYQINLPSAEIIQISPLLSLTLQRKIVNEVGTLAFETLQAVTRPEGLAWSPDSRYFAFTGALDNQSSDLYIYDTLNDRVERLNGLSTQNGTPFWSPGSSFLISLELGEFDQEEGSWHALNVTGIQVPGFNDQNTLYFPDSESQGEVFVGWLNSQTFISYSQTPSGLETLRQVNIEKEEATVIFRGSFDEVGFDPYTKTIAFIVGNNNSVPNEMVAGIYLLKPGSTAYNLQRAGDWESCVWDSGGMFVVSQSQGVLLIHPDGDDVFLADEGGVNLSPTGNWMVGWGDGVKGAAGARLYQSSSSRPLQELSDIAIKNVFWQPDSKGFFLFGEEALYHLEFPALNPQKIREGFSKDDLIDFIWVE
ncbi:MAG: hypothetical protein U9R53_08575 [Chloroflexota bacterium]|nr:hypothetical protein [Chloroflexota bacterium]